MTPNTRRLLMATADSDNRSATPSNMAPWENSHGSVTVLSALLSALLQTSTGVAPTASSSTYLGRQSAYNPCEQQHQSGEAPIAVRLSTADIGRPGELIRNDKDRCHPSVPLPTSITTAPPMMGESAVQDDVLPMMSELLETGGAYDMERPLSPSLPLPNLYTSLPALPTNDNFLFQVMCRNPRNLILDSIYPETVPHIVITPPEPYFNECSVLWQNRLQPQSTRNLVVPQCYPFPFARMPPSDSHPHPQDTQRAHDPLNDAQLLTPKAVFSPSTFARSVECAANERLIMYHVTTAVQKLQVKALACLASDVAKQFRRRYDNPGFIPSLEKPFHWTDPAEPILAIGSRPGNTVLDSIYPMVAPHIIITEPPPQDPWIAYGNATNDPQDCAFLVVPSRHVSYINVPPNNRPLSKFNDSNLTYEADRISPADTPAPGTPVLACFDDALIHRPESNDSPEDADVIGGLDVPYPTCGMDLDDPFARPSCDIFTYDDDDDDEDGLPPFDDWYLTIVARTSRLEIL